VVKEAGVSVRETKEAEVEVKVERRSQLLNLSFNLNFQNAADFFSILIER